MLAGLYFLSLRVDIMEVDATQYAEISRQMARTGSYLQVYQYGMDYLDKPPFLFWVSSWSISLFGATNLGYKLPSILFSLWALFATYRLGRLLYNEATGRWAALILGVCQGMFLMTNDVRADTILMSWVITALWAIKECEQKRRWQYVLLGTVSIACGMMTKGPIALMVPLFCFGSDWVLHRKWKQLISPYHLADALLIAVLLVPMSIGLYQQFDLHPEKMVNGETGVSGLRFFYWSQSFGRITGESPWDNGAGFEFLYSSMLWAFLPWIVLFTIALIRNVRQLIVQRGHLKPGQEFVTTGGFVLAYVAMGSSHYQLPHYIFVVFPLSAIMVAALLHELIAAAQPSKLYKALHMTQVFISGALLAGALLLLTVVFPGNMAGIIFCCTGIVIWIALLRRKDLKGKLAWLSVWAMLVVNAVMTGHFYPSLLEYQGSSQAGRYIKQHHLPTDSTGEYKMTRRLHAWHYYADGVMKMEDTLAHLNKMRYLFTNEAGKRDIDSSGLTYHVLKHGQMYDVSKLSLPFLNPGTRKETLNDYYLLKMR